MQPTQEQIDLIIKLQDLGAVIPEDDHGNPSNEMFEHYTDAFLYINKWKHLFKGEGDIYLRNNIYDNYNKTTSR